MTGQSDEPATSRASAVIYYLPQDESSAEHTAEECTSTEIHPPLQGTYIKPCSSLVNMYIILSGT